MSRRQEKKKKQSQKSEIVALKTVNKFVTEDGSSDDQYNDIQEDLVEDISETEDEILFDSDYGTYEENISDNKTSNSIISRDGTSWSQEPFSDKGRRLSKNILKKKPGLTVYSKQIKTPLDAFNLFITDEIIDIIVRETNAKAMHETKNNGTDWRKVTSLEIRGFIGILLLMGRCRAQRESIQELWDEKYLAFRRPIFPAIMSRTRFQEIYRFVRFDNFMTRCERKKLINFQLLKKYIIYL